MRGHLPIQTGLGILTSCQTHLSWLLLTWKSSNSALNLLTLSLRDSAATLWSDGGPTLSPGPGEGLVAEPSPTGSGRALPKQATWVGLPAGSVSVGLGVLTKPAFGTWNDILIFYFHFSLHTPTKHCL